MSIVVLVKHVVDTNALRIDQTTKQPVFKGALVKISDHDKHAVEEAVRLKEKFHKPVTLISVGPEEAARTTLREALAMGADEAYLVSTGTSYYLGDPIVVIKILAEAIKKFVSNFEIILSGEFSEDMYQGYVGAGVATLLNLPFISSASGIEILNNTSVVVKRETDHYIEFLESSLPAVISVSREINQPRIPTTFQIMRVPLSKVKVIKIEDLGIRSLEDNYGENVVLLGLNVLEMPKRKGIKIEGPPDKIASDLLQYLKKEGVI